MGPIPRNCISWILCIPEDTLPRPSNGDPSLGRGIFSRAAIHLDPELKADPSLCFVSSKKFIAANLNGITALALRIFLADPSKQSIAASLGAISTGPAGEN